MNVIFIFDYGHGLETPGKKSPDGKLKEAAYVREIGSMIVNKLDDFGFPTHVLVPENHDVPLATRVSRVNSLVRNNPENQYFLISLHVNAAGMGKSWTKANGWSVYVSPKASSYSKELAEILTSNAQDQNLKVRKEYPNLGYWTKNLYILTKTLCPAVLTENLFMDNLEDCNFLLSEEGKEKIMNLHVYSIMDFLHYE